MTTATVWLDIETIPPAMTLADAYALTSASVPGNYSKPDSIARWVAEHLTSTWERLALDPWRAQVVCISAALEDDEPETWCGDAPGRLVDALAQYLTECGDVRIAGWHVGWDVQVLRAQAMRCGSPYLPPLLPTSHYDVTDVHRIVTLGDPRARVRMAAAAAACGLDGKLDGIDGADVWRLWHAGQRSTVARYCAQDVRTARDLGVLSGAWRPPSAPSWRLRPRPPAAELVEQIRTLATDADDPEAIRAYTHAADLVLRYRPSGPQET